MTDRDNKKQTSFFGFLVLLIASLLLIHSAMGVSQYKHWLSTHDETNKRLPFDIILECLIGLGVAIFSITFLITRPFKEIVNASEAKLKSMDGLFYSEDFTTFKRRRHPLVLDSLKDK